MTTVPLTHATPAQIDRYADWLTRLVAGKRGSIAERYRNAAATLTGGGFYQGVRI